MELKAKYNELLIVQRKAMKTWDIDKINAINKQIFELRQIAQAQKTQLKDAQAQARYEKYAERFASRTM